MEDLPYCDESYERIVDNQEMPTAEQYDEPPVCKLRTIEGSGDESNIINPWLLENRFIHKVGEVKENHSSVLAYSGVLVGLLVLLVVWLLKGY